MAPPAAPPPSWWHGAAVPALVAVALFARSLASGFTFDDRVAVQENRDVIDATRPWAALLRDDFWGAPVHLDTSNKSYRPLTIALFRLVRALSTPRGTPVAAAPFHALNVALHAGVTAQVHALTVHLATLAGHPDVELCATLTALLFAAHPVHCEAVCGLVGAAELLCALVALRGLRCYAAACRGGGAVALVAALGAALAAALAKETGVTILGSYIGYEWLIAALGSDKQGGATGVSPLPAVPATPAVAASPPPAALTSARRRKAAARRGFAPWPSSPTAAAPQEASSTQHRTIPRSERVCLTILTGVVYLLMRRKLLGGDTLVRSWRIVDNHLPFLPTRLARGLTIAHTHWRFAYLLLLPLQLCADWGYACIPPLMAWQDPRNAGAAALYATSAAVALRARPWRLGHGGSSSNDGDARLRLFHVAALGFAPLVPAMNVLFFVGAYLAERLLYMPSVGFCMLLAAPLARACSGGGVGSARRSAGRCAAAAVIVLYCARTVARVPAWDTEAALFGAALRVCPGGAKVRVNAGVQRRLAGDCAAAERHFRAALAVLPRDYCEPKYGLGLCAVDAGRLGEAADYFEESLECLETVDNANDALRKVLSALYAAHPREPAVLLRYGAALLRTDGGAAAAEACAAFGHAAHLLDQRGAPDAAHHARLQCPLGVAAAAAAGAEPPAGIAGAVACDGAAARVLAEVVAAPDPAARAAIGTAFVQREATACRGTKSYVETVSALQNADPYNPHLHVEWARLLRTMTGRDEEASAHMAFAIATFEQMAAQQRRTPAGTVAARAAEAARLEQETWRGVAAGPRSVKHMANKPLPLQEL